MNMRLEEENMVVCDVQISKCTNFITFLWDFLGLSRNLINIFQDRFSYLWYIILLEREYNK